MRFQVKAVRGHTDVVDLAIEAFDAQAAARHVREQGHAVLAVKRSTGFGNRAAFRRSSLCVLAFTQELVALLEAGLNLVAAIDTLAEKEESPETSQILSRVLQSLHRGTAFSDALEEFPHVFPPLYVATVRSNEKTGGLAESLTRYTRYRIQIDQKK